MKKLILLLVLLVGCATAPRLPKDTCYYSPDGFRVFKIKTAYALGGLAEMKTLRSDQIANPEGPSESTRDNVYLNAELLSGHNNPLVQVDCEYYESVTKE